MSDPVDIYVKVHRVEAGKTYTVEVDGKSESATASGDTVDVKVTGVASGSHYLKAGEGKWPAHGINVHVSSASYKFDVYM